MEFILQNIDQYLFVMIILSGIFVTKYTQAYKKICNAHKVLIASTIISIISFYVSGCDSECYSKYLFTYTLATSFYEIAIKQLSGLIKTKLK
ncbi:hypothetical protein N9H19_00820 [Flavobacteriales bacterium]|nr:hypothetical protein [Flavobacteriales bacterium]